MTDFSRLSELHDLAKAAMVGWMLRYVEADSSWEFAVRSIAPSEDWFYEGSFELGVAAAIRHVRDLQPL